MSGTLLEGVLREMGDVGLRMSQIDAAEGAAGNISVFVRDAIEPGAGFSPQGQVDLPVVVPHLHGGWVMVSGAGRRLRDISTDAPGNVCLLRINEGGASAMLYAAPGRRPTSEFNTHLAVHDDHVGRRGISWHAVVHAQPIHLTYLSHDHRYHDPLAFNRRILRWQPETIVEFPEGIGMLPFQVPGSPEQQVVTTAALGRYRGVVWAHHGIVTRADNSVGKAGDLVEYAEAAARYEYLNLAAHEPSSGLSPAEMRQICERLGIEQTYF
jgi:rhamnulose-1-phosphate aldolase